MCVATELPPREYTSRTNVPEVRRVFDALGELLVTGAFESPTKTGQRRKRAEEALADMRNVMRRELAQLPVPPPNALPGAVRQAIEDITRNPKLAKKLAGMR